jgi:hypothetical protein
VTQLRESLARRGVSKTDKYLLIVAMHDGPMKAADIRAVARQNGWREGATNTPGAFLKQTKNAIYLPNGWTVTDACKKSLVDRELLNPAGVLTPVTQALEKYLIDVHNSDRARFVEEAIRIITFLETQVKAISHLIRATFEGENNYSFPRNQMDDNIPF